MIDKQEALKRFTEWIDGNRSGNLIVFRPPVPGAVDLFVEETIKLHEMDDKQRAAIITVFGLFDAQRAELFRDKSGNPDRIKVTRKA
jgi:hypothetical protein